MPLAPLQFLLLVFAGWVNRRQVESLAYLQEENRVLREQLGDRRLRFTNAQRRRLAVKGRVLAAASWNFVITRYSPSAFAPRTARTSFERFGSDALSEQPTRQRVDTKPDAI
jgi:hypothetical protein